MRTKGINLDFSMMRKDEIAPHPFPLNSWSFRKEEEG
jgi:hypothetical protein